MWFRKRRSKPKTEPVSPVEVVDLSTWNGRGDEVLTPIGRPDSLSPVPHRIPAQDPDQADLRLLITQMVAELHSRGALDGGHADVLDHWIDSQLAGWLDVVDQQALSRARAAEQLLAVDRENLTREALELSVLRQEQLTLDAEYRYWRDALAGYPGQPPRAATAGQVADAPPMPALPDYRPETYLDDHPPIPPVTAEPSDPDSGSDGGPRQLRVPG